ncbi:transglutaminase TgpA family protein [Merismopedia glauca]|uniref:Transglutaminase n=2 Tax=Merismopedia TaxID=53402 RepID=A0A2T1C6C0_9CYAN|nr:transglutaminase [Merismopedia glauca CCAP 1448/3]
MFHSAKSQLKLGRLIPNSDNSRRKPHVEDSIWLRVLVQALVSVGIIATDVAAQTQMSLWAIPLSIIGAIWSWYRRRQKNITIKFFLAMAMIAAMAAFFKNLIGNLNDTRLVLAELLVQLQVLHSFDLPRRKDLGYSMTIGLILLGVAGTVSQTMAFAPLLLVFLAIALPTLILDYRSRLGLAISPPDTASKRSPNLLSTDLSWRRMGAFLLVILLLGLTIFALMPRLPGYQLRSFPVSSPVEQQGEFDAEEIVNPGYVKDGKPNQKGNGKGKGSGGDGETDGLDKTFYYGFNSKIDQSLGGELEPKTVLRVRSQSPGFWRVLAFDRYTGKGWEISRNDKAEKLNRSNWSFRFLLPIRTRVGKTKEVIQSYTAVSELPNVVPALTYPKEVYFPTRQIGVDAEGSIRSPVGLLEGLTYTVVSQVPYRDRDLLNQAGTDYPPNIRQHYLDIPEAIAPQVKELTESVLAEYQQKQVGKSQKELTSSHETALYLAQYLKQHYQIPRNPLGLPVIKDNEDLVESFLFRCQKVGADSSCQPGGYPDQFSTVLTMMLRSVGIPARLVVGFAPGQFNPFTGMYEVRNVDAYAMTEVYFPDYGWFAFDPIPGHDLMPPGVEADYTFSALQTFWNWVAGWLPSPIAGFLNGLFDLIGGIVGGAIAWFLRLFSQGWLGWSIATIVAIACSFALWLLAQQWLIWRYQRWLKSLPPMERLYQQMLKTMSLEGYIKHPATTPLEYATTLRQYYPPTTTKIVEEISEAYVAWRYGQKEADVGYLRRLLPQLLTTLKSKKVVMPQATANAISK